MLASILEKLSALRTAVSHLSELVPAQQGELRALRAEVEYLRNQAYENRSLLRYLAGDLNGYPTFQDPQGMTLESFDYQWDQLPEGEHMLSSASFREQAPGLISSNCSLPESWFAGKRVLDAGTGQGRWAEALLRMGAEVVAVDASRAGLARARAAAAALGKELETHQVDLIAGLPEDLGQFDLVWSFGVLHHTGNTHTAFRNLLPHVKPGGYLYLMVYVAPTEEGHFSYYNRVDELHRRFRGVPLAERPAALRSLIPAGEDLHGWFDAVSPPVKERYTEEEVRGWFHTAGFVEIKRTRGTDNLTLVGRRPE